MVNIFKVASIGQTDSHTKLYVIEKMSILDQVPVDLSVSRSMFLCTSE